MFDMNLYAINLFKLFTAIFLILSLSSCDPYPKKLTIGAAPWPTFEFAFLADELGYLDKSKYSLLELTSPTGVIQAFQTSKLDVAFVSLDEVLTLISLGVDLKIISIVDTSIGGDALLAKPEIKTLEQLKWRAIGYENKAAGALLLDEVFTLTGLNNQTVQLYEIKQNEVKDAYIKGNIEALVTREPIKQELLALGAHELINSSSLSLPITHVIIARTDVVKQQELQIVNFLKKYYRAREFYEKNKDDALTAMSVRLQLYPYLLEKAFLNVNLIDAKQALVRLSGSPSNMELQAKQLNHLMNDKLMLGQIHSNLSSLISTRILERAIYE